MLYTKELFISLTVLIGVQIYRTENCLWSSIGSSVIHTELLFWARVSIGVTPGHERACVSSSNQTGLPQRILFIPLKVQRPEKHQVKKKKKKSFENMLPEIKQCQMEAAQIPWLGGAVSYLGLLNLLTSYIFQCPFFFFSEVSCSVWHKYQRMSNFPSLSSCQEVCLLLLPVLFKAHSVQVHLKAVLLLHSQKDISKL